MRGGNEKITVQEFVEHNQGKTLEFQDVKVPIRKPKYKCKNKYFQKLLIKLLLLLRNL